MMKIEIVIWIFAAHRCCMAWNSSSLSWPEQWWRPKDSWSKARLLVRTLSTPTPFVKDRHTPISLNDSLRNNENMDWSLSKFGDITLGYISPKYISWLCASLLQDQRRKLNNLINFDCLKKLILNSLYFEYFDIYFICLNYLLNLYLLHSTFYFYFY